MTSQPTESRPSPTRAAPRNTFVYISNRIDRQVENRVMVPGSGVGSVRRSYIHTRRSIVMRTTWHTRHVLRPRPGTEEVHLPPRVEAPSVRSDGLKCTRGLGCERERSVVGGGSPPRRSGRVPKGLSTPRDLRIRPKEMRIPPLRSAVKMESDVSLDSSVTPGRSSTSARRTRTHV